MAMSHTAIGTCISVFDTSVAARSGIVTGTSYWSNAPGRKHHARRQSSPRLLGLHRAPTETTIIPTQSESGDPSITNVSRSG